MKQTNELSTIIPYKSGKEKALSKVYVKILTN